MSHRACCADGAIELEALRRGAFGGHVLDAAQHRQLCTVKLQHDSSLPKASESGDTVQGL